MSVKIGSARIDENGRITGGKAGDQTGNEVGTQAWYKHSKGWRAFRPNSAAAAEKIAYAMQAACDNKHIGYNQDERNTLYSAAKAYDFDPAKVTKDVNTDCSALVRVCCAHAGIFISDFNTSSEASALLKSGKFTELTESKYTAQSDYLKRGDILVTKTKGHTVVVLSDGSKASSATIPSTSNDIPVTGIVEVSGTWYLRAEPDKSSPAMGTVTNSKKVYYLGGEKDGWYLVKVDGLTGWISKRAGTVVPAAASIVVGKGNWYVRSAPDKSAASLGTVKEGASLPYQGQEKDGWYLVIFENQNGWISKKAGVIE